MKKKSRRLLLTLCTSNWKSNRFKVAALIEDQCEPRRGDLIRCTRKFQVGAVSSHKSRYIFILWRFLDLSFDNFLSIIQKSNVKFDFFKLLKNTLYIETTKNPWSSRSLIKKRRRRRRKKKGFSKAFVECVWQHASKIERKKSDSSRRVVPGWIRKFFKK